MCESGSRRRVIRGGCWYFTGGFARTAYRTSDEPQYHDSGYGLRPVARRKGYECIERTISNHDSTSSTHDL